MQSLISVIIPIFNLENFLSRTLQSVQEQTYKNLEILLIDDGSIDNSVKICQKFCREDKRFKLLQKENGGASSARNFGLDKCQGDFILFIDGDDFVKKNHIDDLYQCMKKYNADIGISGHIDISINKLDGLDIEPDDFDFGFVYMANSKRAIKEMLESKTYSWLICSKLYRKNILKDIRFNIREVYAEDFSFAYRAIHKAKRIVVYSKPSYYYIRHDNAITKQKDVHKYLGLIETSKNFENFIEENYSDLSYCSDYFLMQSYLIIITVMVDNFLLSNQQKDFFSQYENFSKYISYVRKNAINFALGSPLSFKLTLKIKALLVGYFFKIYIKIRGFQIKKQ